MLLSVIVLIIPLQISAQNLIYKKNGEIVKAKILTKSGKSISFKHFETKDSLTYFLNVAAIDSIISQNGVKETFVKNIDNNHPQSRNLNPTGNHHLIGIDLAAYLLYRNLTFSYEFLPGKAFLGFKVAYTKKIDSNPYYEFSFNKIQDWSTRLGINYYFFPPRTFRLGTGLYYIFGQYLSGYNFYNDTNSKINVNGLGMNLTGFYNLKKNLAFNLGFDIPLYTKPYHDHSIFLIRCEILLNF